MPEEEVAHKPTRSLEVVVTIVAIVLMLVSITLPWYEVSVTREYPDLLYPVTSTARYFADHYTSSGDSFTYDNAGGGINGLMEIEIMLIYLCTVVAVLFASFCQVVPMRVHVTTGFALIALIILLQVNFTGKVTDLVSLDVHMTGFFGSMKTTVEYSWGPAYGWFVQLTGCVLQLAVVMYHVAPKVASAITSLRKA